MTRSGRVIWITGLSGAGKTTLARALLPHFSGQPILLDGDQLREVLGPLSGGYDAASRRRLALTYARLARLLAVQGHTVLVATISLFHDLHAWNRQHLPNYFEIFLDVSEEERCRRDPKGLYAAHAQGDLDQMAGMDARGCPVELPLAPHLHLVPDAQATVDALVQTVLDALPAD